MDYFIPASAFQTSMCIYLSKTHGVSEWAEKEREGNYWILSLVGNQDNNSQKLHNKICMIVIFETLCFGFNSTLKDKLIFFLFVFFVFNQALGFLQFW